MRLSGRLLAAFAGGVLLLGGLTPASAEPLKIRVGWVVAPSNLAPILFAKRGIARHLGTSYILEPVHFAGTSAEITALATGELDIASLAYSTFALAIENAGMSDLRLVADEFQDGVPGYYSNEYMVRKDSSIRSVEELKDKVLASNTTGSAVDMAIRAMLREHNLEDKRDFTLIEVGFPNMKAMLSEHKVDLVGTVPIFANDPGLWAIARTLFTQKEAVGRTQMILWGARAAFLEKNRAVLVDFMEDALRSRRFYIDPANHREVVEIVARFTRRPADSLEKWVFTKEGDYYRDPDGLPDLEALKANIDTQRQLGFLRAGIDIDRYTDLSIVKEAAKRLE